MAQVISVIIKSGERKWRENHTIPKNVKNPISFIKDRISQFNESNEGNYVLHKVIRKRKKDVLEKHDWEKKSLVTEKGMFDKMVCSTCGATGKRFGLGNSTQADKKFHPIYCFQKVKK